MNVYNCVCEKINVVRYGHNWIITFRTKENIKLTIAIVWLELHLCHRFVYVF